MKARGLKRRAHKLAPVKLKQVYMMAKFMTSFRR